MTLFCVLVILAPALYGLWYFRGPGQALEAKRELTRLVARDPVIDAQSSFDRGDYFYWVTRRGPDVLILGLNRMRDYRSNDPMRYKSVRQIAGDALSPEQQALNEQALIYAGQFNLTMHDLMAGSRTRSAPTNN